jgi:hypothetical protein
MDVERMSGGDMTENERIDAVLTELTSRLGPLEAARDAIDEHTNRPAWMQAARRYGDVRRVRDSLENRREHFPERTLEQLLAADDESLMTLRLPADLEVPT